MRIIRHQIHKDRTCSFVYLHPVSHRAIVAHCKDIDSTMETLFSTVKSIPIPGNKDIDDVAKEFNRTLREYQ